MKKVFWTVLGVVTLLLSGCTTATKTLAILPQEEQKNITVYVDNIYDLERQKNAIETYMWAINDNNGLKVEINPEPKVEKLDVSKKQISAYYACYNKRYLAKLANHIAFFTFNYNYDDYNFGNINRKQEFYNKTYTASKIDDSSFEIQGFSSKKEAMDIFIQLVRSTYEYGDASFYSKLANAPKMSSKTSLNDWDLNTYTPGRGIRFDPELLAQENRLVIIPRIMDYSLKNQFYNVLKAQGYTVVAKKEDAQLVINTKFLYYGTKMDGKAALENISHQLNASATKEKPKDASKQSEALVNESAWASRSGNTGIAKALIGVAVADAVTSLFDGNKFDGYFISHAEFIKDGKVVFSGEDCFQQNYNLVAEQDPCMAEAVKVEISRRLMASYTRNLALVK